MPRDTVEQLRFQSQNDRWLVTDGRGLVELSWQKKKAISPFF
jgi:hypothetical protein